MEVELLRYALRLAQISAVAEVPLVERLGSFRLRLLQLLAPALPTDPDALDAADLHALVPRVGRLVDDARSNLLQAELLSEAELDREIATKRLALVLGGTAGAGYIFLGALSRLEELGIQPAYLMGCSIGAILAVIRGRSRRFDLAQLRTELQELRARAVFRPPKIQTRFGLPAALRLDLSRALGHWFAWPDGTPRRLSELEIPVDALATGLGSAALGGESESFAHLVDAKLDDVDSVAGLRGSALARAVSALVALAMSRRVLVPMRFGADVASRSIPALDAAGFSAAIPGLLHYEVEDDSPAVPILHEAFERHSLVALADGVLISMLPARYAWDAIESGRIGTRHCAIVALDPAISLLGRDAWLAPLHRVFASAAHRDRAFCDLHVQLAGAPSILELFPAEGTLDRAQRAGERGFEETAQLLREHLATLRPWRELAARAAT